MEGSLQNSFNSAVSSNDFWILNQSAMLDLISDPALIYQRDQDKLLLANQAFFNLSSYSKADLEDMPLHALIPEELDTNPNPDQAREIEMQLANGEVIQISLKIHSLNPTNRLVLLVFSPLIEENMLRQDLLEQEFRYDKLLLLAELGEQNTSNQLF